MKRIVFIIFILFFITFSLSSCGESKTTSEVTKQNINQVIDNSVKSTDQVQTRTNPNPNQTDEAAMKLLQNAVVYNDSNSCETIGDNNKYVQCMLTVNNALASKNLDISYCEKIPSKINAVLCVKSVIMQKSVRDENAKLCETLSEKVDVEDCQNNYFSSLAILKKDLNFCEQVPNDKLKAVCGDQVNISKIALDNYQFNCGILSSDDLKKECETKIEGIKKFIEVIKTDKTKDCDQISDSSLADYCRQETNLNLAKNKKDTKICDTLSESFTYSSMVVNRNYKSDCLNALNNKTNDNLKFGENLKTF